MKVNNAVGAQLPVTLTKESTESGAVPALIMNRADAKLFHMGIRDNARDTAIMAQRMQTEKANDALVSLLTELLSEQQRTNRLLSVMLTPEMRAELETPARPSQAPAATAAERVQAAWDERVRRQ